MDDRSAPASPNAALEPVLLAQGYAMAGSAYKSNGWAVQDGIADTRRSSRTSASSSGKPNRTLLWGFSMGSIVTLALAEQTAGPLRRLPGRLRRRRPGTPRAWDGAVVNAAAYNAAFGWRATWGSVGDVRDDLDFETRCLPKMIAELSNPLNFGKFEFIRLVTGAAPSAFPRRSYPGWIITNMFFSTEARAELERRAGGPVVPEPDPRLLALGSRQGISGASWE